MKRVLLLLVLVATSAYGMVYSWTDSGGVTHYTNKEYEIPARYRAKVKARYPEPSDTLQPQQNVQTQQAKPEEQPPVATQQLIPDQPKAQQTVIIPEPPKMGKRKRHRTSGSTEE